jgi:hypothetical protein
MKKIFKVVQPPPILDWVLTIMCFMVLGLALAMVILEIVRSFDVDLIKHLNFLASQR